MEIRTLMYKDAVAPVSLWSKITGLSVTVINYRLRHGWSVERTLSEKAINGNNQFLRH